MQISEIDCSDFPRREFPFPETNPEEISCRRIKGQNISREKVMEKIRNVSEGRGNSVLISGAVALIKLGQKSEGNLVLEQLGQNTEPLIRLGVARAYFELARFYSEQAEEEGVIEVVQEYLNLAKEAEREGLWILKGLKEEMDEINDPTVLEELLKEYFKHDAQNGYQNTYLVLEEIENKFPRLSGWTGDWHKAIKNRIALDSLIEQTQMEANGIRNSRERRLEAAKQLFRELQGFSEKLPEFKPEHKEAAWEEIRLIKKAIYDLAQSPEPWIQANLAEILGKDDVVVTWIEELLVGFLRNPSVEVLHASVQTALIWGTSYVHKLSNAQSRLVESKKTQDLFFHYDDSLDLIGNLSIRDKMVSGLIGAWRAIKSWKAVEKQEILRKSDMQTKIISALGYWGINSQDAKKFLADKNEFLEENPRQLAGQFFNFIEDKEKEFRDKIDELVSKVARESAFFTLGALWTIFGFDEARNALLNKDKDTADSKARFIEAIFYNLRFRTDPLVLERFKEYLTKDDAGSRQLLSLEALLEPWWIEGNKEVQGILRNLLNGLISKPKLSLGNIDSVISVANALLRDNSYSERFEIALTVLNLLDRFPAQLNAELLRQYRQIIWMVGERLKN